jgi:hypothetical protein
MSGIWQGKAEGLQPNPSFFWDKIEESSQLNDQGDKLRKHGTWHIFAIIVFLLMGILAVQISVEALGCARRMI